ncbi:MAG TPA: hypothetical protein VMV10_19740 [Pirellulales bacterium]|nr:hypothetical protein [Pirellulales bacterium]
MARIASPKGIEKQEGKLNLEAARQTRITRVEVRQAVQSSEKQKSDTLPKPRPTLSAAREQGRLPALGDVACPQTSTAYLADPPVLPKKIALPKKTATAAAIFAPPMISRARSSDKWLKTKR